jgi:RNA polymerase sigma-70 factor (ECF subfamily)
MDHAHRLAAADLEAALPRLRRYARVLVGGREGADELVAQTLRGAWRRAGNANGELVPWLFGLMHAAHRDVPRGAPAAANDARDICSHLLGLPADERETLLLAAVERLSYVDIARVLDVPVAAVMSTLSRARSHLRAMQEAASPRA